ncbi:MAG: transglutaminase TgpA family protein [bacterium]
MPTDWQLSRAGLFWVLTAFVAVVLLHLEVLPVWVSLLSLAAIIWRVLEYRGAVPFPNSWIKLLLILACGSGLLVSYSSPIGLEPMLALLVAGFSLKFLEMHHKRDAVVLIYLGFFAATAEVLFSQEIVSFIQVLLALMAACAALVSINQGSRRFGFLPLGISLKMLLASIPLALILFLIMPRLGAMWSLPGPQNQGTTGVSDSMAFGDVARLGRSGDVAFRVNFDGAVPARNELYWRGIVLSKFDGRTWTQASFFGQDRPVLNGMDGGESIVRRGEPTAYTITMEPTYNRWLFALNTPASGEPQIRLIRDSRLVSISEIEYRRNFRVQSWLDFDLEPGGMHPHRRQMETEVPFDSNPETQRIARDWAKQSHSGEELIDRVLGLFNQEFTYTLEPPVLGQDNVDEFLWGTKRGFCEHFAGSFVFFMRAAGYPARVVAGYMGGEIHPSEGFVTVRQYDAHAWAEVWLQGKGWVRVDPTAAVAPERVEMSFADLFAAEDEFLADSPLSLVRFRNVGLVNWLRLQMDSLDYAWAIWVLGYDQQQYSLLQRILGAVNPLRIGLFLMAGLLLTALPFLVVWLISRLERTRNPADRLILRFCDKLAKAGLPRKLGEGLNTYAQRIAHLEPAFAPQVLAIASLYVAERYDKASDEQLKQLEQNIRRLKVGRRQNH